MCFLFAYLILQDLITMLMNVALMEVEKIRFLEVNELQQLCGRK
jgi:hypothetical protein